MTAFTAMLVELAPYRIDRKMQLWSKSDFSFLLAIPMNLTIATSKGLSQTATFFKILIFCIQFAHFYTRLSYSQNQRGHMLYIDFEARHFPSAFFPYAVLSSRWMVKKFKKSRFNFGFPGLY